MTVYQADDHNLHLFINRPGKVLITFWAPWCSSCRKLGPVLEELSYDLDDRIIVAKVHVDDNPVSRDYYGITSIPALLIFKDGYVVKTLYGYKPKEKLMQLISSP